MFSVVIPCYNQRANLRETIQSVVTSLYPPIEVIIVDDGSKDNFREVANDLAKEFTDTKARQDGIRSAIARKEQISEFF